MLRGSMHEAVEGPAPTVAQRWGGGPGPGRRPTARCQEFPVTGSLGLLQAQEVSLGQRAGVDADPEAVAEQVTCGDRAPVG